MNLYARTFLVLPVALTLAGCVEGTRPYVQSPDTVIATAFDRGRDTGLLTEGRAAIAYDPDGCQNWIIDDGVEGYSSPRFDPVSGLPICNNHFPAGTVIRDYQSGTQGIPDWTPGTSRR
jgi:hypothetical protein